MECIEEERVGQRGIHGAGLLDIAVHRNTGPAQVGQLRAERLRVPRISRVLTIGQVSVGTNASDVLRERVEEKCW